MLNVEMNMIGEIRMGSPYNVCHIHFSGEWVPDLPETDWQDVIEWNEDHTVVALVQWEVPQNIPGFRIVVVDSAKRSVKISERFQGCCRSIEWVSQNRIAWDAFPDFKGTYVVK